MPAYDYKCTSCGCVFEITRRAGEAAEAPCPECGGATKRVFSPVGVVFKGTGFHTTDYRKSPPEDTPTKAPESCPSKSDSSACKSCPASSE